jgi:hypothetical protein
MDQRAARCGGRIREISEKPAESSMMNKQALILYVMLGAVLLLAGCSPHPGSGDWTAEEGNPNGFTRLVVQFDGKAEFYRQDQEKEWLRCFWQSSGAMRIDIQCTSKSDTEGERFYELAIAEIGPALLKENGTVIARFIRDTK